MLVKEVVEVLLESDQEAHIVMDAQPSGKLTNIKAVGEFSPTERQRFCEEGDEREVVVLSRFNSVR